MSESKPTNKQPTISRPSESGLRHGADDGHFVASIMRCKGWPPDCSYHGTCVFGDCFSRSRRSLEIARLKARVAELEMEDLLYAGS